MLSGIVFAPLQWQQLCWNMVCCHHPKPYCMAGLNSTSGPVSKNHISHKCMASVSCDSEGVVMTDYLQQGRCILCWISPQTVWSHQIKSMIKVGVLLHCDNASAHISHVAMAAVHECSFKLLFQPPYFAGVWTGFWRVQSRYFKEPDDDEVVIMAINKWIEQQDQNVFVQGVKILQQRWEKCVGLWENYVESN